MTYSEFIKASYTLSFEREALEYLLDQAITHGKGTVEDVERMARRLAEVLIGEKRLVEGGFTPQPGHPVLKVTEVRVAGAFILDVVFNDGVRRRVGLSGRLTGGVFERLKNAEAFAAARVDLGIVVWPHPNGDLDVAPEYLYHLPEAGTEAPYPWEPAWSDRLLHRAPTQGKCPPLSP